MNRYRVLIQLLDRYFKKGMAVRAESTEDHKAEIFLKAVQKDKAQIWATIDMIADGENEEDDK